MKGGKKRSRKQRGGAAAAAPKAGTPLMPLAANLLTPHEYNMQTLSRQMLEKGNLIND